MANLSEYTPDSQPGILQNMLALNRNVLGIWPPNFYNRDLTYQKFANKSYVLVNKPEYIEHILLKNSKNYQKSEVFKRIFRPLMGNGLLISEGDYWKRQRKIAAPAFRLRKIGQFVDVMAEAVSRRIADWPTSSSPFDISTEMVGITVDIIARTMFSTDVAGRLKKIDELMNVLNSGKPNLLDVFGAPDWVPRFRSRGYVKAVADFEDLIAEALAPRRAGGANEDDLLSMLLSSIDPDTGEGMDDQQLRDEIITIFAAGHETTAVALSWALHLIASNSDVHVRLSAEIDTVLGGRLPEFKDLKNLIYTRMVFEEAIRLYPPAYLIQRVAMQNDEMDGVQIPAGTLINISPFVTHRNSNLWRDPNRFDPSRFDPSNPENVHRFAYLPFGAGPRICVGMQFAIAEAQVIIATIMQRYTLRVGGAKEIEPTALMSLRPRGPVLIRAELRPKYLDNADVGGHLADGATVADHSQH